MRREIIEALRKMETNDKIKCFMLATDKGICVKGTYSNVLALIASIVSELKENGVPVEELEYAFKVGLDDKEETKVDDEIDELTKKIKTLLKEIEEFKNE